MKKYNISKPRKYTDKQGNEKTFWDHVGEMIEFENGNMIIKIPAIGLEANVFEDKPKEEKQAEKTYREYPTEEVVNPKDIPDERISPEDQGIKPGDIPF